MQSVLLALQLLGAANSADPFAFFEPTVSLSTDDRRQLDRGEAIARVLPGRDGEVAVFAAVPVDIDGDRLVAWTRQIAALKKSSYVSAIGRFSSPPRIEDLSDLVLDDQDMSDIRACHAGRCELKLSAPEMAQLQRAAADAGRRWKPALQEAFRRVVLQRVEAYVVAGQAALPPYENEKDQVWPAKTFMTLLDGSKFLTEHVPGFAEHLRGYPLTAAPHVESFIYWSKEHLARRAIVRVTHVSILRGDAHRLPDALVAGKEIFSTHYFNGSLGITAILRGEPGGRTYLAYLNRSEVDVLGGVLGGVVRWFVQRRLKEEAATVLQGLRQRLESGDPPAPAAFSRGGPLPDRQRLQPRRRRGGEGRGDFRTGPPENSRERARLGRLQSGCRHRGPVAG